MDEELDFEKDNQQEIELPEDIEGKEIPGRDFIIDSSIKKPYEEDRLYAWQIDEIKKCKDVLYFVENYCWVKGGQGVEKYKPLPFQVNLFKCFSPEAKEKGIKDLILIWSRQNGKTISVALLILHQALFCGSNKDYLVLANTLSQAKEIIERIKLAYEYLPKWLKCGVLIYNQQSVKFDNGSRIVARATSASASRGLSPVLVYSDEFAFVEPATLQEEFYTAMIPTLSRTNGRLIISSTPNTDYDMFAQIRRGAENYIDDNGQDLPEDGPGYNGFKALHANWDAVPGRDEEWKQKKIRQLGSENQFLREFECQIVGFDNTLIDGKKIKVLAESVRYQSPIEVTENVKWYRPFEKDKKYIIALDPSTGVGGDFAAIEILSYPGLEQVGEWMSNKLPMEEQTYLLKRILSYINDSMRNLGVDEPEIYWTYENNIGDTIKTIISDIGLDVFSGELVSEPKHPIGKYGLLTNHKNKMDASLKLKNYIERDKLKLHSKELVKQLSYFVRNESGFAAKSSEHDDAVLALLLCVRIIERLKQWDDDILDDVLDDEDDYAMPLLPSCSYNPLR